MVDSKLPKDIIDYYSKYRNTKSKLKTSYILGTTKFDLDDHYEIIDSSK